MKCMRFALFAAVSLPLCSQTSPPNPAAIPRFTSWIDPVERAFTVNVPAGWQTSGGTHRNAPIDARNYIAVQSPDKQILAWVDDPNILPRQVPHPAYYRLGYYEGRVVETQAGPLQIERFRTGAQFAQEFVEGRFCKSPESLASFDLRQETQLIDRDIAPVAARAGVRATASA